GASDQVLLYELVERLAGVPREQARLLRGAERLLDERGVGVRVRVAGDVEVEANGLLGRRTDLVELRLPRGFVGVEVQRPALGDGGGGIVARRFIARVVATAGCEQNGAHGRSRQRLGVRASH